MPRTYVDNAYNRRIGRVGMPHGSMVVTGSGYITTRTYVDNAQNRKLDRVGMFRGSLPEYMCDSYTDHSDTYYTPKWGVGADDGLPKMVDRGHVTDVVGRETSSGVTSLAVKRTILPPRADGRQVKSEPTTKPFKTEPGVTKVKTEPGTAKVKTEPCVTKVKTEPVGIASKMGPTLDPVGNKPDVTRVKTETRVDLVKSDSTANTASREFGSDTVAEKPVSTKHDDVKAEARELCTAVPEADYKPTDYRFQQLCKVSVTETPGNLPLDRGCGIQVSSKYGLTFVAIPTGFKVMRTADFTSQDAKHASDRLQHVIHDFPLLAHVNLGEKVTHLALSCDDLTLAIATVTADHTFLNMYDVRNFAAQVTSPVSAFLKVNLSGGQTGLLDMAWNPVSAKLLVTCLTSGRLDMYEITDQLGVRASADNAKARCVCWSPKGKQLVVGTEDGLLVQYDPDLTLKRKWEYPSVFPDQSYQVLDLMWLSTYTFMAAYISSGADCSDQPHLLLVNGSKDGATTYTSFEDVCYGNGEERQRKYYFQFLQKWDMLVAGSSNGSEIVVVGKHLDNKECWERWNLDDACRAECPLTESYVDTFPMGFAIDFSSQTPVPLGEDKMHPPVPLLLMLSTEGIIIPYMMMYLHKDAPPITEPPQTLDTAGLRKPLTTGLPAGTSGTAPVTRPGSAVKNLFGNSSPQTTAASPFSAAPSSTNQTLPKPVFPGSSDQSALKSALAGSEQNATKPGFGVGQSPFNFSSSTPKSGSAAGAAFSFSSAGTSGVPAATPGFGFGQTAGTAPSFGFPPKAAGSTVSDAVLTSGTGALGSNLGPKPTDPGAQTSGYPFKVGASAGTQQGQPDPSKPQALASTTTAAAPPFGTSSAPAFSSTTFGATGISKGFNVAASTATPALAPFGSGSASSAGLGSGTASTGSILGTATTGSSGFGGGSFSFAKPTTTAAPFGFSKPGAAVTASEPPAVVAPPTKSVTMTTTAGKTEPGRAPAQSVPAQLQETSSQPPDYPESGAPGTQLIDHSFSKSIMDEIHHFNQELSDLKSRAASTDFTIGSSEEMTRMKKQTEGLGLYCDEMKKTMQDLNKDVQDQTAFCLDMFSSVEECRMRETMMTDSKYHHLLKSRPLDPGSADKLQTLQQQYQVLDQGLRDVDLILDTQWEDYQNRKKNRSNRMQAPTNDALYRVVKSHHNIIVSQKVKLGQLEERLKQLKLYNQTVAWNTSTYSSNTDKTELSTLADSLVSTSPVRCPSHSSSQEATLGTSKLARLRDQLYRRHVPVVKSTRPENLSMSKIALEDSQLWRSPEKTHKETKPQASTGSVFPAGQGKPGEFIGMTRRSTPTMNQMYTAAASKPDTRVPQGASLSMGGSGKPQGQGLGLAGSGMSSREAAAAQAKQGFGQTSMKLRPDPTERGGKGFGLGDFRGPNTAAPPQQQQPQVPVVVSRLPEMTSLQYEDVTPSGSEHEVETTEEDEEYDEEEDSSGGSNGGGFGAQYNIASQGTMAGTPVSSKLAVQGTVAESSRQGTGGTPAARKLFAAADDDEKSSGTFKFNTGTKASASPFSFGTLGGASEPSVTTTTAPAFGQPASTAATSSGSFSFGQASTTVASSGPFSFGQTPKTGPSTAGQTSSFQFGAAGAPGGGGDDKAGYKFGTPGTSAASTGFTGFSTTSASVVSQSGNSGVSSNQSAGSQPSHTRSGSPQSTSPTSTGSKMARSSGIIGQPSDADNAGPPIVSPSVVARSTRDEAASGSSGGSMLGAQLSAAEGTSKPTSVFGQPSGSAAPGGVFGQPSSTTPSLSLPQTTEATKTTTTDEAKQSPAPDTGSSITGNGGPASSFMSGGLFGKSAATSTAVSGGALFGKSSASSTPSLFGLSTSSAPSGLFGVSAASTAPTSGLFGSSASSASSSGFGASPASSATVTSGLFGSSTVSAPASSSEAPPASSAATASSGLFGSSLTTSAGTGQFGQTTSTPSSFGFGGATTTTAPSSSTGGTGLFGSSGGGLFGQTSGSTGSPSGSGLFGQATSSSTGSPSGSGLFGQATSSSTGSPSGSGLFGQATSSTGSPSGSGLFGQATSSAGGLFGTPASSGGGLFGSGTTSTAPAEGFGQKTGTGLFGSSPSGFGTATSSGGFGTSTSGAGFGTSTSGAGFGTTTSGAGFGTSTSGAGFGFGQSGFGQAPAFGQTSGAGGGFGTSTSGGEGGMLSGLGGKPSEEKAGTNVFEAGQSFGSVGTSSGLFGSQSQGFGNPGTSGSSGGPFSSGAGSFSSAGQGVGSTGFSGLAQQSTGGFGSAPAFGSPPAFGSTPAFGSAPKFGNPPAFGAGTTGFGGAPAFGGGATFGSPSTSGAQTAGFAGFAAGASPTFGALAQSTDAPSFGALGGGEGGFGAGGGAGGFGSPSFGGTGQSPGFGGGGSNFGNSPSFSGYRG